MFLQIGQHDFILLITYAGMLIQFQEKATKIPHRTVILPSFGYSVKIHHFACQTRIIVAIPLYVIIDVLHAQQIYDEIRSRVVALGNHQLHYRIERENRFIGIAAEDACSAHLIP